MDSAGVTQLTAEAETQAEPGQIAERERVRTLDFFMGLGFTAIGAYIVVDAFRMLGDKALSKVPACTNPGTFSMFIGVVLAVMGVFLALLGWSGSGALRPFRVAALWARGVVRSSGLWKGLLVFALIAGYFFGLIGHMPYWLATFVYLTCNMLIFGAGRWWKVAIIAGAASWVITYFFGTVAMLPLP